MGEPTSVEAELDRLSLDQLHAVVLNLSKNCFELKKLCVTLLISGSALIASFTSKSLDYAFFIAGLLVVGFFWMLDAQSYFYQERLRHRMRDIERELLGEASGSSNEAEGIGMELSADRTLATLRLRSLVNWSMLFYLILVVVDLLLMIFFAAGWISSS